MGRHIATRIEMFIVVALIVILASVTISTLGAVKGTARATSCQGRLHQLDVSLELYRTDCDGHGFSYRRDPGLYKPSLGLWSPLASYLPSTDLVWCPNAQALQRELTTLYRYRSWSKDDVPTLFLPFEEEPMSVVAYCANHTQDRKDPRASAGSELRVGRYPFVRQDGSASIVSNRRITIWHYDRDWRWTEAAGPSKHTIFRFGDEPWPPKPDFAQ